MRVIYYVSLSIFPKYRDNFYIPVWETRNTEKGNNLYIQSTSCGLIIRVAEIIHR